MEVRTCNCNMPLGVQAPVVVYNGTEHLKQPSLSPEHAPLRRPGTRTATGTGGGNVTCAAADRAERTGRRDGPVARGAPPVLSIYEVRVICKLSVGDYVTDRPGPSGATVVYVVISFVAGPAPGLGAPR